VTQLSCVFHRCGAGKRTFLRASAKVRCGVPEKASKPPTTGHLPPCRMIVYRHEAQDLAGGITRL